jgi:hypothetical protein
MKTYHFPTFYKIRSDNRTVEYIVGIDIKFYTVECKKFYLVMNRLSRRLVISRYRYFPDMVLPVNSTLSERWLYKRLNNCIGRLCD